jgi:hypothetical protein
VTWIGAEVFATIHKEWGKAMTPEERVRKGPSLDGVILSSAGHLHEVLWRWYCSESDDAVIWQGIWDLHAAEEELDKLPPNEALTGDLDARGWEFMGTLRDVLRTGTWNVLRRANALDGVDQRVLAFSALSFEDLGRSLPPERTRRSEWRPAKTLDDFRAPLQEVIALRLAATVGSQIFP